MKKIITLVAATILFSTDLLIGQINPAIKPYVTFLETQPKSAKEYILSLFETHDIVVICERDHRELLQYDLFLDIIRDKRFLKNVGNVFTEVGTSSLNPGLNKFLHTKSLSLEQQQQQLISFERNLTWFALWDNYNYYYFLQSLYAINNALSPKDAVSLYPSDLPIDWSKMDSTNFSKTLTPLISNRDSIMAQQIITCFDNIDHKANHHRKALVIMNYRHAFPHLEDGKQKVKNTTGFLMQHYGKRLANVYLAGFGFDDKDTARMLQEGRWDAALSVQGNRSVGFDFKNTIFGKDNFDLWTYKNNYCYQDIFTGFAFYLPLEDHKLVRGIPGLIDRSFLDEFLRRYQLGNPAYPSKKPSQAQIATLKENIADLEKEINNKQEFQYDKLKELLRTRMKWLQ